MGYKIERLPRGGIAERMVGVETVKTNSATIEYRNPQSFWFWAMFKATQDLNFSYCSKIEYSPYHFVTGHHIDVKYLHSFFAECYLFILLKDRDSKLTARRAHRCRFLAYSYTTILVPTYVVLIVHDNGTYGPQCVSKDNIFDESCVYDKYVDNAPSDVEFAAIALTSRLCHLCQTYQYYLKTCLSSIYHRMSSLTPHLYACVTLKYIMTWSLTSLILNFSPSQVIADNSEYVEQINQYRHIQHWNIMTGECSNVPVKTINSIHSGIFMSMFLISSAIASSKPSSTPSGIHLSSKNMITSPRILASSGFPT